MVITGHFNTTVNVYPKGKNTRWSLLSEQHLEKCARSNIKHWCFLSGVIVCNLMSYGIIVTGATALYHQHGMQTHTVGHTLTPPPHSSTRGSLLSDTPSHSHTLTLTPPPTKLNAWLTSVDLQFTVEASEADGAVGTGVAATGGVAGVWDANGSVETGVLQVTDEGRAGVSVPVPVTPVRGVRV